MAGLKRDDCKITTVDSHVPVELLRNARAMRKNPTKAEKTLWKLLRNRNLDQWKFRRQNPIAGFYILDFYCPETGVAIEVDGDVHQNIEQHAYDENRSKTLSEYGVQVIRFTNDEVFTKSSEVLDRIIDFTNSIQDGK